MNGPYCRPELGKQGDRYDQQLTLMTRPKQTSEKAIEICLHISHGEARAVEKWACVPRWGMPSSGMSSSLEDRNLEGKQGIWPLA